MLLSQLQNNQTAYILHVGGTDAFVRRLAELGFVPGQEVTRLYASPMGTPIVFSMLGQRVALRRSEAESIGVSL
ncbi:MAG: ferrous iron transport protein A, partial [Bacteroidaceae bacterium]|nr:ferrous iron transport protein A [Bacteroidaceae bacterium]